MSIPSATAAPVSQTRLPWRRALTDQIGDAAAQGIAHFSLKRRAAHYGGDM
jgi:hypothetical protein